MESKSNKQSSYALRVFIKKEGEADQMIWSRVGDQGKEKLSSNVTLISKLPFEVRLGGGRGSSRGFLARELGRGCPNPFS